MIYPTITEYIEAIRFSEDNFDKLTNLVPVLKDNGEPYYSSGNFAVVFKMKDKETGKLHAVKCFLKDQEGREESYRKISNYLETIENRYLIKTKFLEKELFVDSKSTGQTEFPVVVMDWVEGVPLDVYIREKINDKMYLEYLCYTFSLMAQNLIEQEFAHGDLKPDNILVKEDGMLVLVDYDGMYVPEMFGERSRELGSPDFQHPDRKLIDFDKHLDDFSLASILLSLKLISIDPSLLEKYGDKDRLLFSQKDYREFPGSEINAEIFKHFENKEVLNIYHLFLQALGRKMCVWNNEMWKLEVPEIIALSELLHSSYIYEDMKDKLLISKQEIDIIINLSQISLDIKAIYGLILIEGFGHSTDIAKGLEYLFDLSLLGNLIALNNLAICYLKGDGVSKNIIKGIEYLKKSAEGGSSLAQLNLGCCYDSGVGVEEDVFKAVDWYLKSAEQGNTKAQYELCRDRFYDFDSTLESNIYYMEVLKKKAFDGDFRSQYYMGVYCEDWAKASTYLDFNSLKEAINWYSKSAEQGEISSMTWMADYYKNGIWWENDFFDSWARCTNPDMNMAIYWYKKLSERGSLSALHSVGSCYSVLNDEIQAIEWYSKSANQGYAQSQYSLGLLYESGRYVPKDLVKAFEWFKKSALQGNSDAQYRLGVRYENGVGVPKDCGEAIYWYLKSVDNGFGMSLNKLGLLYYNGNGVNQDYEKAVEYFSKSAEQGYSDGQLNLGICYCKGNGVLQDFSKAFELFKKSAKYGNERAQYKLALCYEKGVGVLKNMDMAVEWYTESAGQGYEKAKERLEKLNENADFNFVKSLFLKVDKHKFFSFIAITNTLIGNASNSVFVKSLWVDDNCYCFETCKGKGIVGRYSLDEGKNWTFIHLSGDRMSLDDVVKFTCLLFKKMGLMELFRQKGGVAIDYMVKHEYLKYHE